MKLYPIFANWLVSVSALLFLFPLPMSWNYGVYNDITNRYWCSTVYACNHERAHQLDREQGWISHSVEFKKALEVYILADAYDGQVSQLTLFILDSKMNHPPLVQRLFGDPDAELYADIYAQVGGDAGKLPPILRPFYEKK
jgi:hypothetical protein